MKLDYNCVRNILLTVESLEYGETLCNKNFLSFELSKDYSKEQMEYTVLRLSESGYIPITSATEMIGGLIYSIDALTREGHQYLDCIRNQNVWDEVLKKVSGFGNVPFRILTETAFTLIRLKFGLSN